MQHVERDHLGALGGGGGGGSSSKGRGRGKVKGKGKGKKRVINNNDDWPREASSPDIIYYFEDSKLADLGKEKEKDGKKHKIDLTL